MSHTSFPFGRVSFSLFLLLSLFCLPCFADPLMQGKNYTEINAQQGQKFEGENIDLRTGLVSWEVRDVHVPGTAGLDLDLYRQFNGGERIERGMENWNISLPRITFNTNSLGTTVYDINGINETWLSDNPNYQVSASDGICSKQVQMPVTNAGLIEKVTFAATLLGFTNSTWWPTFQNVVNMYSDRGYYLPSTYYNGIQLYIPGQGSKNLLPIVDEISNNSGQLRFDAGKASHAKYATDDNWIAECVNDTQGKANYFRVTSPEGRVYSFDKISKSIGDPFLHRQLGQYVVYPSSVNDKFGNKLTYTYSRDTYLCWASASGDWDKASSFAYPVCPITQRLKTISSSDGGKIEVTYENTSPRHGRRVKSVKYLDRTWNYFYSEFKPGYSYYLSRVELPDKTTWEYTTSTHESAMTPFNGNDWARILQYQRINNNGLEFGTPDTIISGYILRAMGQIGSVKTPTGARIDYTYNPYFSRFFGDAMPGDTESTTPSVRQRTLTIDLGTKRTYTYTFTEEDFITSANSVTTINLPNTSDGKSAKVVYKFDRTFFGDHAGTLKELNFYANDEIIRTELFSYEKLGEFDVSDSTLPKKHRVMRSLRLKRIYDQDTTSSNSYRTQYSNFDKYGFPRTITESSPSFSSYWVSATGTIKTLSKVTNFQYKNTVDLQNAWIIGSIDLKTIEDPDTGNYVVDTVIDSLGETTEITENGKKEAIAHNDRGDIISKTWTDNEGNTQQSLFSDHKMGIPQFERHPEDITINREVDDYGLVTSETNGNFALTNYKYDNMSRVTGSSRIGSSPTSIVWNLNGNPLLWEVTKGNKIITNRINQLGEKTVSSELDTISGETIHFISGYDAYGNKTLEINPTKEAWVTQRREFDLLGRLTKYTDQEGNSKVYCYRLSCLPNGYPYSNRSYESRPVRVETINLPAGGDVSGSISQNVVNVIFGEAYGDFLSSQDVETYYPLNENSGDTRYGYTALMYSTSGALLRIRQGGIDRSSELERVYSYYSGTHLIRTERTPEVGTIFYTYGQAGLLKSKQTGSGSPITFIYDGAGRKIYEDYDNNDGTTDNSFGYDFNGNMSWADNGFSRWEYQYNSNDDLESENLIVGNQSYFFDYDYNYDGKLDSVTYPDGEAIHLQPNANGNPTAVGKYASNIKYHDNASVSEITYGNGVVGRFPQTAKLLQDYVEYSNFQNDVSIKEDYFHDFRGNIFSVSSNVSSNGTIGGTVTEVFRHNPRGFLVYASTRAGTFAYTYDQIGNIQTRTLNGNISTYNFRPDPVTSRGHALLESITSNGQTLPVGHDSDGNITSIRDMAYSFDNSKRLMEANGVSYVYDALGRKLLRNYEGLEELTIYSKAGMLLMQSDAKSYSNFIYAHNRLIAQNNLPCNCSIPDVGSPRTTPPSVENHSADLKVELQSSAVENTSLRYTVRITNNGPNTASEVRLYHSFPDGAAITSFSPTKGSCVSETGSLSCDLGGMYTGEHVELNMLVSGLSVTDLNSSGVVSVFSSTADPDWENNVIVGNKSACISQSVAKNSAADNYLYVLRDFRDVILAKTSLGREFIHGYYSFSLQYSDSMTRIPLVKAILLAGLWVSILVAWLILNPIIPAAIFLTFLMSAFLSRVDTHRFTSSGGQQ